MPGFVAYAEGVVLRIADIEIPEIEQAFEFIGIGKFSAEIFMSPAYLADVEIAERVVGMPGGASEYEASDRLPLTFAVLFINR